MIIIYFLTLLISILFIVIVNLGPNFAPSTDDRLKTMLRLASPKQSDKIIDLGCGDGKVVIALAQLGFKVEGVDINPFLVNQARAKIKALGLENLVTLSRQNFWRQNYSDYDLVFIFGITHIMKRLERKLRRELKPGSRVISNYFQFPHWTPTTSTNDIHLYINEK